MDHVAPGGPVYQAGTLSGNPLAMAAGWSPSTSLQRPGTYERLETLSARLHAGLLGARGRSGRQGHDQPRGLHDHALLHARPRARLRERQDLRHRALRALLPRPARARHLLPARAVRGGVRVARAHARATSTPPCARRPRSSGSSGPERRPGEGCARWAASHSAAARRSARFRSLSRLVSATGSSVGSSRAARSAPAAGRRGSARSVRAVGGHARDSGDLADAGHRLQRAALLRAHEEQEGPARRRRVPQVAALLRGHARLEEEVALHAGGVPAGHDGRRRAGRRARAARRPRRRRSAGRRGRRAGTRPPSRASAAAVPPASRPATRPGEGAAPRPAPRPATTAAPSARARPGTASPGSHSGGMRACRAARHERDQRRTRQGRPRPAAVDARPSRGGEMAPDDQRRGRKQGQQVVVDLAAREAEGHGHEAPSRARRKRGAPRAAARPRSGKQQRPGQAGGQVGRRGSSRASGSAS